MNLRQWVKIIFLPFICAAVGCALLFIVSCIPDSLIKENSSRSAAELKNMGAWSVLINEDDPSCTLDTYTDQQIIMEAYTLSRSNPGSVLLNPRHWTEDESQLGSFDALINQSAPLNSSYFRYWMGFRVFVRPLLVFTDYYGMLKLVGAVLLFLSFCTAAAIGRIKDIYTAACFALAIALVNPAVVAQSLQFSCCFILSLLFMLIVLKIRKREKLFCPVFCFFGIATQFFDFYTTPLLCFGFPIMLLLCFLPHSKLRWIITAKTAVCWFFGYVSMWIVKLLLTSLFTVENGFADGFNSLAGRLGIKVVEGLEEMYDARAALQSVWWLSCPGDNEKLFFIFLSALVFISALVIFRKEGFNVMFSCGCHLAVALMPVIWFCCAAQPTLIHSWFQYRSIAVLFAGIFLFSVHSLSYINPKKARRY